MKIGAKLEALNEQEANEEEEGEGDNVTSIE